MENTGKPAFFTLKIKIGRLANFLIIQFSNSFVGMKNAFVNFFKEVNWHHFFTHFTNHQSIQIYMDF